jgi:hypothetical protein
MFTDISIKYNIKVGPYTNMDDTEFSLHPELSNNVNSWVLEKKTRAQNLKFQHNFHKSMYYIRMEQKRKFLSLT